MSEIPRRRDFLKLALSAAAAAAVPRVLYARGAGALGLAGDRTPANILDDLYAGLQLYWGDLHGHTAYSDGYGAPKLFYDYGGIKNLDFCGVSDHSEWINYFQGTLPMADGSPVPLWKGLVQEVNNRYVPGRFVTFPGYEYTNDQYGHRTIVFANPDQVPDTLASSVTHPTPPDLWQFLEPYTAMTIPHHVTRWGSLMDWDFYNPVTDRLVEIYSKWGNGASVWTGYEPMVKYLQFPYLRPLAAASGVDAMLDRGYKIGILAGTDSHQGHPGSTSRDHMFGKITPEDMYPTTGEQFLSLVEHGYRFDHREPAGGGGGLAGVWSSELTRESVWQALYARRTIGTTGIRPTVKFGVVDAGTPSNGATMGNELTISGVPLLLASTKPVAGSNVTQVIFYNANERLFTVNFPGSGDTISFPDLHLGVGETGCYRVLILIHQEPTDNLDGDSLLHSPLPQLEEQVWTSPIWVTRGA